MNLYKFSDCALTKLKTTALLTGVSAILFGISGTVNSMIVNKKITRASIKYYAFYGANIGLKFGIFYHCGRMYNNCT